MFIRSLFRKTVVAATLATCFFIGGNAFGQEINNLTGFYVTQKLDTVRGIFYTGNAANSEIKFKKTANEPWQKLDPQTTVLVECTNGTHFESRELTSTTTTNSWVFAERILFGGHSLFTTNIGTPAEKVFYLKTPAGPNLIRISKTAMEAQFRSIFGDCFPANKPKPIYSEAGLTAFLLEMNRCADPASKSSVVRKKLDFRFGIGATGFFYHMNPSATEQYNYDYKAVNQVSLGMVFRLKFGQKAALETGFSYINKPMITGSFDRTVYISGWFDDENGFPYYYNNLAVSYKAKVEFIQKYIEVPLVAIYEFWPNDRVTPVVNAGIAMEFPIKNLLKSDVGFIKANEYMLNKPPIVHSSPRTEIEYQWPDFGYLAGIGLRFKLGSGNDLNLGVQYVTYKERLSVADGYSPFLMHTNRVQFSLNFVRYLAKK